MATESETQLIPDIKAEPDEEELPLPEHVTVLTVKSEDVLESGVESLDEDPLASDADLFCSLNGKEKHTLQPREELMSPSLAEDRESNDFEGEEVLGIGRQGGLEGSPSAAPDVGDCGEAIPETVQSSAVPWKMRTTAVPIRLGLNSAKWPFECGVCGKKFSVKDKLEMHSQVHAGERPFGCGVCGKKFALKDSLKMHSRFHTGQGLFECGVCGKKYSAKCRLEEHSRVHTGERPFECGDCGKTFTTKGCLKRHSPVHTGDRPFECGVCGKKFKANSSLKVHSLVHTQKTSFECGVLVKYCSLKARF